MARGFDRHIAIDVRMLSAMGIGTYLRNLVPRVVAAKPDWRFTLLGDPAVIASLRLDQRDNVVVRAMTAPIYTVAEQFALRRAVPRDADLVWSPHYNIPLAVDRPLVVTVHDVIHLARPEYTRSVAKRAYARMLFRAVRDRAVAIMTVSEFTRQEFIRLVGEPKGVISVVPNGVDEAWFEKFAMSSDSTTSSRPYIVCIGSLKPHKNIGALIAAFSTLKDRVPHDLLIIGRDTGLRTMDGGLARLAQSCGDRVRFTGEVDDMKLRQLVAGADALVHPALYEGFGLPLVEAMAAGCPCVASTAPALREVGGDAVQYAEPTPAGITERLEALLKSEALRADLSARGPARARSFSWNAAADAAVDTLEDALGARLVDNSLVSSHR